MQFVRRHQYEGRLITFIASLSKSIHPPSDSSCYITTLPCLLINYIVVDVLTIIHVAFNCKTVIADDVEASLD